jgi:hypothetical protein
MSAPASSTVERESARLEALDHFDILDTPSEEAFDRITRLAKKIFRVPIAIVSFIDAHRQWYKSCPGARRSRSRANIRSANTSSLTANRWSFQTRPRTLAF